MTGLHRGIGIVAAVAATYALAAASRLPVPVHPADDALVRLAWSVRPERMETCRTLGKEELEELPAHMRQRVVCEGTTARYRLELRHDDRLVASALVRAGGMRRDRQVYVFREVAVPSGPGVIEVRLARIDSGGSRGRRGAGEHDDHDDDGEEDRRGEEHDPEGAAEAETGDISGTERDLREVAERRRRIEEAVPPLLVLRDTVRLAPREVLLVSYDRAARRLRTVRGRAPGADPR